MHTRSSRPPRSFVWLAVLGAVTALGLAPGCASSGERVNEAASSWTISAGVAESLARASTSMADPGHAADYRIGPEDLLSISVADLLKRRETSTFDVEVDREGRITLPLVGSVDVAKKTAAEVRREISAVLGERYMQDPQVSVAVTEHRAHRIVVLGAVNAPGVKVLTRSRTTVIEALALSGGLISVGGPQQPAGTHATIVRKTGAPLVRRIQINLERLAAGDIAQNLSLVPGDILQVPTAGRYAVLGFVQKVGEYPLDRRTTVLGALAAAGGIQVPAASPTLARVLRPTPDGHEALPVDLVAIADGEAQNFELLPGDVLEVQQSTTRAVGLGVYEVFRGLFSVGLNLASFL